MSGCTGIFCLRWCSAKEWCNLAVSNLLYRSACKFFWGWHAVLLKCINPRKSPVDVKHLFKNCVPFSSIRRQVGGCSARYNPVVVEDEPDMCRARFCDWHCLYDLRMLVSHDYYELVAVCPLGNKPRMSMAMNPSAPLPGKNFTGSVCILFAHLRVHWWQSFMLMCTWSPM